MKILIILVLAITPAVAQTVPLTNLKGAELIIEEVDKGTLALGLTYESLQASAQLRLRSVGFEILPINYGVTEPFIHVSVTTTENSFASMIAVELHEPVEVKRIPGRVTTAATWIGGAVISHPTAGGIRDAVVDYLDRLLNDWLAANPVHSRNDLTPDAFMATHHE